MLKRLLYILALMPLIGYSYADGGFFAGVGVGYGTMSNTTQGGLTFNNGATGTANSDNFASSLYFGYDFNHYVGLEGDYNVLYNSGVANSYSIAQQLLGVSIIGHLPFALFSDSLSKLSLLAKVGLDYNVVGFTNVSYNCNSCVTPPNYYPGVSPIYGGGVEYGLTDNFGLRAEYNYQTNMVVSTPRGSELIVGSNIYILSAIYHF